MALEDDQQLGDVGFGPCMFHASCFGGCGFHVLGFYQGLGFRV